MAWRSLASMVVSSAQRLEPVAWEWHLHSSHPVRRRNYTPCPPVRANWKMACSRMKARGLALCLGEVVLFFEVFDFWTGLPFGGRWMQAVLLEHLVEIGPVTAGELGRA